MSFYEKILPKVLIYFVDHPLLIIEKKLFLKSGVLKLEFLDLPYNVSNISNITALDPAEELTDIAKKISELVLILM